MTVENLFESMSRVEQFRPKIFRLVATIALTAACGGGSYVSGRSPEQKPDSQPVVRVEPWLTPLPNGAQAAGVVIFRADGDAFFSGQVVFDVLPLDGSAGYGADVILPKLGKEGITAQVFVGIQDWGPRFEMRFWQTS